MTPYLLDLNLLNFECSTPLDDTESSGIRESAPPPFHLSALSRFHVTKTRSPQPAASLSLTPPFLPPSWKYLFLAQIFQATSMPTSVKARFEQSLPRAQLASFLGVSTQLHTGPALMSDMVDIYATQIALEERMRETGRQQEATQFKSKQKVRIYNFRGNCRRVWGFTHCRDIK